MLQDHLSVVPDCHGFELRVQGNVSLYMSPRLQIICKYCEFLPDGEKSSGNFEV